MSKNADLYTNIEKKNEYRKVFLAFVGACLLCITACFIYYVNLSKTIEEESTKYLQEIAGRIGTNIDTVVKDNFTLLHSISTMLDTSEIDSYDNAVTFLQHQRKFGVHEDLILLGETGRAYSHKKNKEIFLNLDQKIIEQVATQKEVMSTTQMIDSEEFVIFFVPLEKLKIGDGRLIALGGCYSIEVFDQLLSMNSFDEKAYSQIITKSGTAVTKPTSKYAINSGYNIFTSLEKEGDGSKNNLEEEKGRIGQNENGQVRITVNGTEYYMIYTSIQPDEWYLLTFVPVSAVNEKSEMLLRSTLIICALIALTFSGLITMLVYIFSNNERKLRNKVYIDEVTGGHTIQYLYELAETSMKAEPGRKFALIYTNWEKFKLLNEQIGRENCDKLLRTFDAYISAMLVSNECIGRISADNFCIFTEYTGQPEMINRLVQWRTGAETAGLADSGQRSLPSIEFGIYVIEDKAIPFPIMIDRAKLSLKESSKSIDSKTRYAFYDDKVRMQMIREKQLEDRMEDALSHGEFKVYLQPKYSLPLEQISGAEALARWISPEEGMIYPNEFIPLFEKNGFVVKLDLWVFEEVCSTIQRWTVQGRNPIKISVNCSRASLQDIDFIKSYKDIAEKYRIPQGRIELELTESMVFDDVIRLRKVIEDIKAAGFGCSMDDFGSGYSSLNLIKTIPVDTLKLDRIFFYGDDGDISQSSRTGAVVESIINMSKALSMETVAEGVELREQVEVLKRVGCNYIQGYVFAKPMEIEAFEMLAFTED